MESPLHRLIRLARTIEDELDDEEVTSLREIENLAGFTFAGSAYDIDEQNLDIGLEGDENAGDEDYDAGSDNPFATRGEMGKTAPRVDVGDWMNSGGNDQEASDEEVMAVAHDLASERHPGYILEELSPTEQSALITAAMGRLGRRSAIPNMVEATDFDPQDAGLEPSRMQRGAGLSERADDRAVRLAETAARRRYGKSLRALPTEDATRLLAEAAAQVGYKGDAEIEEQTQAQAYDDSADGEDYDDGDGFDPSSDRHGPANTDGHVHGRFAEHSHNNDADHSDAPLKRGRTMSRKASEPTLSEMRGRHAVRLAEFAAQRRYGKPLAKLSQAQADAILKEAAAAAHYRGDPGVRIL